MIQDQTIVRVEWLDATFDADAQAMNYSPGLSRMVTVGFLVGEAADCITVAMDYSENDGLPGYRRHLSIPTQMILSSEVLTVEKPQ